jgi:hypothetical protein
MYMRQTRWSKVNKSLDTFGDALGSRLLSSKFDLGHRPDFLHPLSLQRSQYVLSLHFQVVCSLCTIMAVAAREARDV